MSVVASVSIHESQWPEALAAQLCDGLRSRRINPKFHYDSPRQVRHWLRLHEVYSPARREADFQSTYAPAFDALLHSLRPGPVHLIGLGCGGGQKEAALLQRLVARPQPVAFTAIDSSVGMVLTALQAGWIWLAPERCSGLVCDLALVPDLDTFIDSQTPSGARRVLTFFGLIPNFAPEVMGSILQRLVRPGDLVLCTANLAPGTNYQAGVEQVLPQYDNQLTHDWLGMLLTDLEIPKDTGGITFDIEEEPAGSDLLRIAAYFEFQKPATAIAEGEVFDIEAGSRLALFFSYRHTVKTLTRLLAKASLQVTESWISDSGEEGVFLAERP